MTVVAEEYGAEDPVAKELTEEDEALVRAITAKVPKDSIPAALAVHENNLREAEENLRRARQDARHARRSVALRKRAIERLTGRLADETDNDVPTHQEE